MLKQRLVQIRANDCQPPEAEELDGLLVEMQASIGSPDPELRDELIYSLFSTWITQDRLTVAQLRRLLAGALGEQGLFYRVGETGADSVFTRTFSALLVALVVYAHRQKPFLSAADVRHVRERIGAYVEQERDRRGYVEGPGWAHAAAHTADVLDELAQCAELGEADLSALLAAAAGLIVEPETVYTHEEDERISVALVSITRRESLPLAEWEAWLACLTDRAAGASAFPARLYARINVKNALRAFYFRLRRQGTTQAVGAELLARLETAQASLLKF